MCQSMVDIQSAAAEIRRGKKERRTNHSMKLECGPMPNLMVALPNIGGALCSTPQSLADADYKMPSVTLPRHELVEICRGVPNGRTDLSS